MLVQDTDMIHNSGFSDKLFQGLMFNEQPAGEFISCNPNEFLWSSLSPLSPDFLRDRDDLQDEINQDYDDEEYERALLFRDVNWSAYSSESESVFIKQEKEDECIKRLVSYGIDGSITPVEDGCLTPMEDGSFTPSDEESMSPDELDSVRRDDIKPYTPIVDHSYHMVPTDVDLSIVKCEEEEKNVDIWTKAEELEQYHPIPVAKPPRKNMRRNIRANKTVSINKAAKVALKRTKPQAAPKRQKLKNSVETTPSSSDSEDMSRYHLVRDSVFNRRGAKSSAMQALSRMNTTVKIERSTKRSDHNIMEKKRRQELRERYESLRDSIPSERFRGGSEKVRTNPSKQQILITAKKFIKSLAKDESTLKEQKRCQKSIRSLRKDVLNKLTDHFKKILTNH